VAMSTCGNLYNGDYGSVVGSSHGYPGFRNKLRIKTFTKLINPSRHDKILELGCNTGELVLRMSEYSDEVVGIDINQEQVERLKIGKIHCMSATELEFQENKFDKVCAFEVVEHIPALAKVFQEVWRVLKHGGKFIFSFPVELFRGQTALIDAIRVFKNPIYSRKLHVHRLTPGKIKKILKGIPFQIKFWSIKLVPYPTFVMILEKSTLPSASNRKTENPCGQ
jgi:SAM-dependent methyltransferase